MLAGDKAHAARREGRPTYLSAQLLQNHAARKSGATIYLMQPSPLRREVLLPPSRRTGTAVVLLSALAMFATVAVSAFAIRIDAVRRHDHRAVAVHQIDNDHDARMWRLFVTSVQANDSATALYAYQEMSEDSPNRLNLQAKRDEIARGYHDQQMRLLADELQRNDCTAATRRVAELARLVPERKIDTAVCR